MRRSVLAVLVLVGGSILGVGAFLVVPPDTSVEAAALPGTVPPPPATTAAVVVSTTTTAMVTTTTEPPREWLTIQGAGDVNFDPSQLPVFTTLGYEHAFSGLRGLLRGDDVTVINLECTASDLGRPLAKAFTFRCDPAALPVAVGFGVDVANLANNHGQDFGIEAMLDARANVLGAGILPVGVGSNLAEATAPAVVEVGGWRVAVLGMGGVVPSDSWLATGDRPGMASGDDIEQVTASIRAAADIADLVVVTIHWGWELETEPRADDRMRAEAMVAAGADVVFGHHPHRLGELEMVDGVPVFWTLGNFIWPRMSEASATTGIARVVVSPDGAIEACLIPVVIETSGRPVVQGPAPCSEHRR